MIIRKAKQEDKETLWQIQSESARTLGRTHYTEEQVKAWAGDLTPDLSYARAIQRYSSHIDHGTIFVAEDTDGRLMGFVSFHPETGEVSAVYVHPDYARRGIGRHLMKTLEDEARRLGVTKLHLRASLNAVAFYERMGFKFDHEIIHRFRTGIEIPCVIMTKDLP